jgi:hypothetical protein
VAAGILAGEAGSVHVGVDKGYMSLQVQTAIGKQVYLLTIVFIMSILVSFGLMYQVSRPLLYLRNHAWHAFSDGDRGEPPPAAEVTRLLARTDEVGEIGRIIRSATWREL